VNETVSIQHFDMPQVDQAHNHCQSTTEAARIQTPHTWLSAPKAPPIPPEQVSPTCAATAKRLQAHPTGGTESTPHQCNVGRPATKGFYPPTPTRNEGSTKTKRVVGQLRRASILQHQTQWIGNDRLCVLGSVSSPQAFLIFLNRGTLSQLTLKCDDVEMRC
jgi:hypothetical protein